MPAVKDEDAWDDSETVAATRLVSFGEMDFIVVGCLIKKRERERGGRITPIAGGRRSPWKLVSEAAKIKPNQHRFIKYSN